MKMSTAERVEKMMRELGNIDQPSFGALAGASKSVVNQWLSGGIQSIGARYAFNLQKKTGYNAEWIMLGDGSERLSDAKSEPAMPTFSKSAIHLMSVVSSLDASGDNTTLLNAAATLLSSAIPKPEEAARGNPAFAAALELVTRDPASLTPESILLLRKQLESSAGNTVENNNEQKGKKAGGSRA